MRFYVCTTEETAAEILASGFHDARWPYGQGRRLLDGVLLFNRLANAREGARGNVVLFVDMNIPVYELEKYGSAESIHPRGKYVIPAAVLNERATVSPAPPGCDGESTSRWLSLVDMPPEAIVVEAFTLFDEDDPRPDWLTLLDVRINDMMRALHEGLVSEDVALESWRHVAVALAGRIGELAAAIEPAYRDDELEIAGRFESDCSDLLRALSNTHYLKHAVARRRRGDV